MEISLQHLKVSTTHMHVINFFELPSSHTFLASVFLSCFISSYYCDDLPSIQTLHLGCNVHTVLPLLYLPLLLKFHETFNRSVLLSSFPASIFGFIWLIVTVSKLYFLLSASLFSTLSSKLCVSYCRSV